jgi:tRNA(Arg) A34 adenosine deaminase TadA
MDILLSLPEWVDDELKALPSHRPIPEDRMREVIRFSRLNFERQTGGPFAAGIFEQKSGKIITIGVNRVVASNCSSAHAEVMGLSVAQQILKTYDLGGAGLAAHQLVVNWRPCAMCMGAMLWSGIRSLMIAGSGPELEQITGFDEGPVHPDWKNEITRRGIEVIDGVLNDEAIDVCRQFAASGQVVYNGRKG